MTKAICLFTALIFSMSINAQTMKIIKGDKIIATYTAEEADKVTFEEECAGSCRGYMLHCPSGGTFDHSYRWPGRSQNQSYTSGGERYILLYRISCRNGSRNIRNAAGTNIDTVCFLNLIIIPSYQLVYGSVIPGQAYNDDNFSIPASSTTTPGVQIHQTNVTSDNGCETTIVLYLDVRTDVGIDEPLKFEDLTIYPNPTTGLVSFKIKDEELLNSNEAVKVYDISGRLLQSFRLTDETSTVNLSNYSNGLYIIKVGHYIGKIIKK